MGADSTSVSDLGPLPPPPASLPARIGKYQVLKVLGEGGFGRVFLARDAEIDRHVAIKVPKLALTGTQLETFLDEARFLVQLEHPHIVPVYHVDRTDERVPYIVSRYMEGGSLAQRMAQGRLSFQESADAVAVLAEALHHAHRRGFVHRDIKPDNILLDTSGTAYVADFGVALKEEHAGKGARFAGTPLYMSPEQARGEGHRVDGRSDIYSLGVVFYELLAGRRPFHADSQGDLLEQIASVEVRPPRQIDDGIPRELERVCLKALSKRASERYTTAKDMAEDLRCWLAQAAERGPIPAPAEVFPATPLTPPSPPGGEGRVRGAGASPTAVPIVTPPPVSPATDSGPIKIVPKGLRSYDAHDADFFLELLPGPRDREGLPESIRFWKTRIEQTDPDHTFAVGLIYGPSGCGKSSLVKAGLLPRLAADVLPVYVEATAEQTESRLLNSLRKRCPTLVDASSSSPSSPAASPREVRHRAVGAAGLLPLEGLKETVAALRRGHGIPLGKKVLIVLDQFEQWLHAKRAEQDTELVQALRQCDGTNVQAIVMVRDDFWMAATRFMGELEIPLLEGQNSAVADLFPVRHAEKVLAAFGRAFGALPASDVSRREDPALQSLLSRLDLLADSFRELREGVQMAVRVAEVDPEMALTRVRKVLEFVIREVFERRVQEPAGTRPLENLLQRIVKDGHFPDRLDAYANTIRKLGNVGTHGFGANITAADVHQSLTQLMVILDWYFQAERPDALSRRTDFQSVPPAGVGQPFQADGQAGKPDLRTKEHQEFLTQAVAGLSQEGKVICVRLALFAEMMKDKPWTSTALKEVGGAQGVGVTFLEETFSAANAPAAHRYHQKAARAVLKALLPEAGTDIKGHMRSHQELLDGSGYASRPKDFDELLRLLDGQLRLITPTEEAATDEGQGASQDAGVPDDGRTDDLRAPRPSTLAPRYYQLTHDYLVPSLREWLTRKQKETRRGRAELLLADRAAVWNTRPENRQLPSLWQWCSIHWWTRKKNWTRPERIMMRKATRYHAVRGLVLALAMAALTWSGLVIADRVEQAQNATYAAGLVRALLAADLGKVSDIIAALEDYRLWANDLLRKEFANAPDGSAQKLHASLALLPVDGAQVEYLYKKLIQAEPDQIDVLRKALENHKPDLTNKLWDLLRPPVRGREQPILCAASSLALYAPEDPRWHKVNGDVAEVLAGVNPFFVKYWLDALRPVRTKLVGPLGDLFKNQGTGADRLWVANILADYAADQPGLLADLVQLADERTYAVLFPKAAAYPKEVIPILQETLQASLDEQQSQEDKEKLANRQANAAVALLKMNQAETVWPLLKRGDHPDDPRARSYLIHRFGPLGADAGAIIKRLDDEPDVTIRRALILCLGEFGETALPADARQALLPKLQDIYRTHPDPGLHAAAEWLLRTWGQQDKLNEIELQLAKQQSAVENLKSNIKNLKSPTWYVNSQGQTMVVIPGPVEFWMGSPSGEKDRFDDERLHKKRIGRTFAVAAKPVTVGQYRLFDKTYTFTERYAPESNCPVVATSWHQAAAYCNWLSEQERIDEKEWCYEITATGQVAKLKENYLSLTGYRLPTEAEMEYACRAEARTSRSFGETEELLGKYAWFLQNAKFRSWPVGSTKPNDFGFFDMHGNVWNWCQESYGNYPSLGEKEVSEDKEDSLMISSQASRVLRGGSFNHQASQVRSAYRSDLVPPNLGGDVGFRPARTLPLGSFTALSHKAVEGGRK